MPDEPMTAEQAQAQIATLERDDVFTASYRDRYHIDHTASVDRMAALYQVAHADTNPDMVFAPDRPEPLAEGETPPEPKSADEVEDDARRELVDLEATQVLGEHADERIAEVRGWLGPEVTTAFNNAGHGDDIGVLHELCILAEGDKKHLMRAALQEYVAKGTVHGSASLALARKQADGRFMAAYVNGSDPNHAVAVAEFNALSILESPPKWAASMMEALNGRSTGP